MNAVDELGLTEKLLQLHRDNSLSLDDLLIPPKFVPMGRLFEKGNDYARRYGIETVAMVCALRHLGCSMKGIAHAMRVTGKQSPSLPTISAMIKAPQYQKIRTQPQCLLLTTQYVEAFDAAFKHMPGWRPSADAVQQVQQNPKVKYRGSGSGSTGPHTGSSLPADEVRRREHQARLTRDGTRGQTYQ
ncbi:hypothetical protein [Aeromonas dhakensis]|uniref:hypothetical protein n=1 Tax=Aeromonas dhakensis TaxID=196024 RepID=UPI0029DE4D81|nr:hypothetical protein [Aeromonas dhakensis]MDX7830356.1 hypothetical protein [Aeromonas dhakensis]